MSLTFRSVANAITGAKPPSPPTAAEIQTRLDLAKGDHARLTLEHANAAYDAVMGTDGAHERQDDLAKQLADLAREIGTLSAAIDVAREREAVAAKERRVAALAEQIKRVQAMLDRREKYAQQLTDAIEQAVTSYRLLIDNGIRASIAFPGGEAPPGVFGPRKVARLVAAELYRQGGVPPLANSPVPSFPGASAGDHMFACQPERIKPLVEVIAEENAYAAKAMRGDIPASAIVADVEDDPLHTAHSDEPAATAEPVTADHAEPAEHVAPVDIRIVPTVRLVAERETPEPDMTEPAAPRRKFRASLVKAK